MRVTSTLQAKDGHEYEIAPDPLGTGGQGAVYRGRRCSEGTEVAIKRIVGGVDRGPEKNRELQIALRLGAASRQYLLAPVTWAIDGADLLLVMPLADRSLADELAQHPEELADEAVVPILRDIATGLVELRAAEIVHRDLKPANVLFFEGRWHVGDFGMSRELDVRTATETFQYGGTLLYWAPERWRGQPASYKTDLYALGCVGYELVTGHWPFLGPTAAQLQQQHLHGQPPPVPAGPVLARWIMRLLDKDPAARHQDAQAALGALPASATVPGPLAAAGLQRAQRRQQEAAAQASADTAVEAVMAQRRQALADLGDICAAAADNARQQLPDVVFSDHVGSHRFSVDDVELAFIVWRPFVDQHGAVFGGEVSTLANDRRRCAANVVCETEDHRLTWHLDTFTRNPMHGIVEAPAGFDNDTAFFDHYRHFRQGGAYAWDRQRQALSADLIVEVLASLLTEATHA
ncbi:MAG: serine/threonine-protein kinase [Pseudonocardiaceae bacterium]